MQSKGNNGYSIGGIIVIILIFVLQALMPDWSKQLSPNRDDAKLKELRKLAFDTPTYPEFDVVSETSGSRDIGAHISERYRSSASYDNVKKFYSDVLLTKGWVISEERDLKSFLVTHEWKELIFKKDDISIVIEYRGRDSLSQQYNYSVSYSWKRK
jgi:hypothetical protein